INGKPVAPTLKARVSENLRKKPGRTEIQRGILSRDEKGEWRVATTGKQGSGILRSMSLANAFIVLEHEAGDVKAGEWVTVQPFAGFL
ncbi:MAG: molybdopterin molybdenumtransferase MoeA, partial [Methylicorpusculum sp.]|nr:molybdopterin molybdenumtransferase MoeA [Methylicorpusculum sp.]